MKGFIELHTEGGEIGAVNIKYLKSFSDYTIVLHGNLAATVKETYEEIKQLVEISENE